jgi:hypothetical protein
MRQDKGCTFGYVVCELHSQIAYRETQCSRLHFPDVNLAIFVNFVVKC